MSTWKTWLWGKCEQGKPKAIDKLKCKKKIPWEWGEPGPRDLYAGDSYYIRKYSLTSPHFFLNLIILLWGPLISALVNATSIILNTESPAFPPECTWSYQAASLASPIASWPFYLNSKWHISQGLQKTFENGIKFSYKLIFWIAFIYACLHNPSFHAPFKIYWLH